LSIIGQITQKKNTFQRVVPSPAQKPQKGRSSSQASGGKKENKCYWCRKPVHFKQECPEGSKKEKTIPLMAFEEK
jgi:hypothetical protein